MIAIVFALASITFGLLSISAAIKAHTREVRAIAEQEAEERRSHGLDLNKAARWQG